MFEVNCIIVLNKQKDRLLFCKRISEPYTGLYNFVGGKIENGEDSSHAAYRELFEETGITEKNIKLQRFMDFTWHIQDIHMEVYAGVLNDDVELVPEKHPLHWLDFNHDFYDMNVFAGEGNIGYMLEILKMTPEIYK